MVAGYDPTGPGLYYVDSDGQRTKAASSPWAPAASMPTASLTMATSGALPRPSSLLHSVRLRLLYLPDDGPASQLNRTCTGPKGMQVMVPVLAVHCPHARVACVAGAQGHGG